MSNSNPIEADPYLHTMYKRILKYLLVFNIACSRTYITLVLKILKIVIINKL